MMKFEPKKLLKITTLFSLFCLQATQGEAFLAGAKATGMAATGVAYPQDAYAAAYNPAGAIDVGDRFDVGFDYVRDHGRATIRNNLAPIPGINGHFNAFSNPNAYNGDFGINKNFYSEVCGQCWNWSLGLVFYNHDYQKTTYKKPLPIFGTTKAGLEYVHETLSPYASLRINECHSIGVSVDIHGQRAKVNGIQNFDNPLFSAYPGHVTNNGYSYAYGVGASVGWKWQVQEDLTLGVVYHSKATMGHFKKYKGFLAPRGRVDCPERWALGLAYKFMHCATLTFDVEWENWHGVKALHNPLLRNGTLYPLGSNKGPGFGFRNQVFYRVGVDYNIDECWTVRMGYRYAQTFVRKSQTAVNLLLCDVLENVLTFGASYQYDCSNEFTFFYAHGFEYTVKGKNDIPAIFGFGDVSLKESKDILGISWGYLF